ncbi:MAG: reverse transcriptase N-terminal domain-containing protein [Chlamydiota bacterium]
MTAQSGADANPYGIQNWSSINWNQVQYNVRRLQARIVKAFKRGEHKKVKNLQSLLKRSLAARLMAVKRVTTNRGSKTPGVDQVTWTTSAQKLESVEKLKTSIHPKPLRRIYIAKKKGKRPLGIPTMIDRAHQALYLQTLDPIAETKADKHSGFGANIASTEKNSPITVNCSVIIDLQGG